MIHNYFETALQARETATLERLHVDRGLHTDLIKLFYESKSLITIAKNERNHLVSKGLMSSIEDMYSIEDTFQPYVHSGTIRPIR